MNRISIIFTIILICFQSYAQKPRARDLGIPFDGETGELNAITDVKGVEVGYSTIISGNGENIIGKGPVRTGVTAIFPRGKAKKFSPVYANWYSLNGNGEMTGTTWVTESGFLETPIICFFCNIRYFSKLLPTKPLFPVIIFNCKLCYLLIINKNHL